MFDSFMRLLREICPAEGVIPLHEPCFRGNEKQYLLDVIDSGYVSSIGAYVNQFEAKIAEYCGVKQAVATVSGTSALHIALLLAGVRANDLVLTQAVSFVATCNAIQYCGAEPVFVDISPGNFGMSPEALKVFLGDFAEQRDGVTVNKLNGKRIAACVPMHSFGHPCAMESIVRLCRQYRIPVVEDAAEALGSLWHGRHCGSFGLAGVLSFNGNKIMTTGGGGMILTNDEALAIRARHLSMTAKITHPWEFFHDEVGYNYRMPNLNAALGLAQLEQLPVFLARKRALAERYIDWAKSAGVEIIIEPEGARSNYWLNALLLDNRLERDRFLAATCARGTMTRALWRLMPDLPMYNHCQSDGLANSRDLEARLVNIPSSAKL
jgi:aminotransferase in exopolysaccharide biosynthesis